MENPLYLTSKNTGLLNVAEQKGMPAVQLYFEGCQVNCRVGSCDPQIEPISSEHSAAELVDYVINQKAEVVIIAGGEPMLQPGCFPLIKLAIKAGLQVFLETNGTIELDLIPKSVIKLIELKCPSQGVCYCFVQQNYQQISPKDILLFNAVDRSDYAWAIDVIRRENLLEHKGIFFLPVSDQGGVVELEKWLEEDGFGHFSSNNFEFIAD